MINFLLFSRQVPQSIINDTVTQACLRAAAYFSVHLVFFSVLGSLISAGDRVTIFVLGRHDILIGHLDHWQSRFA